MLEIGGPQSGADELLQCTMNGVTKEVLVRGLCVLSTVHPYVYYVFLKMIFIFVSTFDTVLVCNSLCRGALRIYNMYVCIPLCDPISWR